MSASIRAQIQEYVEELAKEDNIDPSINLFEAGLLTSVHVLDLIACLEETFEISISPDDLSVDNFGSIDAMVSYTEVAIQRQAA
ncbi:MAG: acyl carrier protein [Gemmatimonadota bacterium]|nr:MAG: acyl carrier protein [Gemmatimonadota bacterium]